ncbi:MAG: glycosyltransferase family 4 protein [Thermoleophilaceae bacterium]
MPDRRVLMALMFFPRGGSAQVNRYMARFLPAAGWDVTLVSGSLGGPGELSNAATFFCGPDVHAVDYTAASTAPDPLAADPPFHPSYEERADAPDIVFARVGEEAYERLVHAWGRALGDAGAADADVLHLNHLTPINEAAERQFPDVPRVGHLHGTELLMLNRIAQGNPDGWEHAEEWAERMRGWARRCARLLVLSTDAVERVPAILGVEPERVVWAPNGFDPEGFGRRPVRGEERVAFWRRWLVEEPRGWDPETQVQGSVRYRESDLEVFRGDSPVFLYVGRYTDVKRIPLMIRAHQRALEATGADAPLVILGGYPGEWEGEHPLDVIRSTGARDVFLAGWRGHDELPDGLNASDVVVLASVHEQFGQVLVEGMACGLPAIAVDAHGPATIIEPGKTGWLAEPDDEESLARAMAEAIAEPERRREMGERAYVVARERYSWPALAERVARVYDEVVADG